MYEFLQICSETIADAVETINKFIVTHYNPSIHSNKFPKNSALIFNASGFNQRSEFMKELNTPEAKQVWEHFLQLKQETIYVCARDIGNEFESEFGLEAIHTGSFPSDWVKPG